MLKIPCLSRPIPLFLLALLVSPVICRGAEEKPKPFRLPAVSLKEGVIWGATCDGANGMHLAFGGQDQDAPDGRPHTRIMQDGQWSSIADALRAANPLAALHDRCAAIADRQARLTAQARSLYFQGLPADRRNAATKETLLPAQAQLAQDLAALSADLRGAPNLARADAVRAANSVKLLDGAIAQAEQVGQSLKEDLSPAAIHEMWEGQTRIERAAEPLDAEPAPRALSPIVFDARTGLFVLFGGDHCDYVTNDTWTFDPKSRRWTQRHPAMAPPPRGNHTLVADGTGKVRLSGGYQYSNDTDYTGGQYINRADGDWIYDIAADTWTSASERPLVEANTRLYRTGPFHPDFYLQGPAPDAAAFQQRLAQLPTNQWVSIKPPFLPQLNRDWGTAVLDPDRDQILRFAGGHVAHGGSDVLHFHLTTGRWELPFPVEFPLGQTFSNTEYPNGFNFNARPWITGHTYQSYGYDPVAKKMLFTGRKNHFYIYDPDRADWTGRAAKPKGMNYGSAYYTLTICPTPAGLVCWTNEGEIFRYDATKNEWTRLAITGEKLPGSVVDNSTIVYDSKRDRLLMVRKSYGDKHAFDGRLYAVDLKTMSASQIDPSNAAAAAPIPYLCQLRYDPAHDLLLAGCVLPSGDETDTPHAPIGPRRTPAYDCATNRWISLNLTGEDFYRPKARDVSLGLVYDAKRGLFWAVNARSNVYVLKLDPTTADPKPL